MKGDPMKRRQFLGLGMLLSLGSTALSKMAFAADKPAGKGITEKDLVKEGAANPVTDYCLHPEKQPNKFCKDAPKDSFCHNCMFYNKDNSETTFKGGKYARCQLFADATKPQFVSAGGYCRTYVKKP
jgi:hypothetical protein